MLKRATRQGKAATVGVALQDRPWASEELYDIT